ncbi:MAG: acylphosphatase [FCB group bacterium]|nr:acylphosphatase [FCB group bacterium]
MSSVAAELIIYGFVQGVSYRYFCYRKAVNLNLTGWVRNNPDGSVQTFVEGERGAIEIYIKELKTGTPASSVTDIKVKWYDYSGKYDKFKITF